MVNNLKRLKVLYAILVLIVSNFLVTQNANAASPAYLATLDSYKLIHLPEVQLSGLDGTGQTIVVIDNGAQINHPYLNGVIVDGNCTSKLRCGNDYLNPSPQAGGPHFGDGLHGSMVSGIISGQSNEYAPGGVSPKAKIISIDNTDGNTEGLFIAMNWILTIQKKYNVVAVSASLGAKNSPVSRGGEGTCSLDPMLSNKIQELIDAGISMVFAAGNDGDVNNINYPSCLPNVISVGALTSYGDIQGYSNISKNITVLAPSDIISSNGSNDYFLGSGTSAAAPVVAGAIALLKQANPNATTLQIKKALQTTRVRTTDLNWSNIPVLDVEKAVQAIKTNVFDDKKIELIEGGASAKIAQDKAVADAKAQAEVAAKIAQDIAVSEAKAQAEVAAKIAQEKAVADAKAAEAAAKIAQDKAVANAKAESEANIAQLKSYHESQILDLQNQIKALQVQLAELLKPKSETIVCTKGSVFKIVKGISPKCPTGYKKN